MRLRPQLQRLHQQVQANLEHYRESAREQRLLDQERNQQIQTQLEQTIQTLKQELVVSNEQRNKFQKETEVLSQTKDTLQQQHDHLVKQHELTKTELMESEKAGAKRSQAAEHWQEQYQKTEARTEEQDRVIKGLETKVALLTQKLSSADENLQQLIDKNNLLTQEKWELAQEKSQLIGQIKQLKIVTSN